MQKDKQIDSDFLEKLIIKSILVDKSFLITISDIFLPEYFDNQLAKEIYQVVREHNSKYNTIPTNDIIINYFEDKKDEIKEELDSIQSIDFDYTNNYPFVFDNTNEYMKSQALKKAILSSVDIIEGNKEKALIQKLVEEALCKDLRIDLGLNYFDTISDRLKRILSTSTVRIPSYFPTLDEMINGGFPPYTLTIGLAAIHAGKSSWMANMAARQVLRGHNVVLLTLEMSEDMFAQRFDSIYSTLDINKIYTQKTSTRNLVKKLKEVKEIPGRGNLFIKQFATGEATRNDFRKYLKELEIRGTKVSIIYADYINLMKPSYMAKGDMYSDIKRISEELRALSFEFSAPVVSVSQLNREGGLTHFSELNFNFVSESIGQIATADAVFILGVDEDKLIYENELHFKISKNRLGGRVGDILKMFSDSRTLKLYDELELDQWIKEAEDSGDSRENKPKTDIFEEKKSKRSRKR